MSGVVDGFTREGVAERAGVDATYVDRLVRLGLLTEREDGAPFSRGDVRRARLMRGLEEGGLPLDDIGTAVRNGDLSFRFLDLISWDWHGGFAAKSFRQLSAEFGLSLDMFQVIRESMGLARPEPDDHARDEELDMIPVVQVALRAGVDAVALERLLRVWGESMRKLTEATSTFYHMQIEVPLLRSGLSAAQMVQAANEAVAEGIPYVDRAIVSMYHAYSERTWLANVVEAVEATLENAGLHRPIPEPPAISFLDLSGYTRLTEERGDAAAAAIAATLGDVVQRSAQDHGGRVVKWLGDGVMLVFPRSRRSRRVRVGTGGPRARCRPSTRTHGDRCWSGDPRGRRLFRPHGQCRGENRVARRSGRGAGHRLCRANHAELGRAVRRRRTRGVEGTAGPHPAAPGIVVD